MKRIIFAQVLTTNGTTEFWGLYDENGNPRISPKKTTYKLRLQYGVMSPTKNAVTAEFRRKKYSVPVPCTKTATGVRLMTTAERNRRWFHENTCV